MNEVKRILNYWKEVNLLTPVTVKSVGFKNQKSLSTKEILKVPYNRLEDSLLITDDKKYEIEIGFGDIKNTYLYEKGNIPKEDFVVEMEEKLLKNIKKNLLLFLNFLIFFLKILFQKTMMTLKIK